jgi:protein TonB
MRSGSCFILSVTLHAAALAYPVTFAARNHSEAIPVTVWPLELESPGGGGTGGSGRPLPTRPSNSPLAPRSAVSASLESKTLADPDRQTLSAEIATTFSSDSIALVSDNVRSTNNAVALISSTPGADANGSTAGLGGIGDGNGFGSSGAGVGRGSGHGNGSVSAGAGIPLTHARYLTTPRPDYPASARREGRQGHVLLRILVDVQGRSKSVEINNSSGTEVLDRAAVEAIKRWRFHPARYGDKAVESWLKVPIEFRLEDAQP